MEPITFAHRFRVLRQLQVGFGRAARAACAGACDNEAARQRGDN